MADQLALELVDKGLATKQLVLTVGYDIENLTDENRRKSYRGEVTIDHLPAGKIPKHAHGKARIWPHTSSSKQIWRLSPRCLTASSTKTCWQGASTLTAANVLDEAAVEREESCSSWTFSPLQRRGAERKRTEEVELARERAGGRRQCWPSRRNSEKTPSKRMDLQEDLRPWTATGGLGA